MQFKSILNFALIFNNIYIFLSVINCVLEYFITEDIILLSSLNKCLGATTSMTLCLVFVTYSCCGKAVTLVYRSHCFDHKSVLHIATV